MRRMNDDASGSFIAASTGQDSYHRKARETFFFVFFWEVFGRSDRSRVAANFVTPELLAAEQRWRLARFSLVEESFP